VLASIQHQAATSGLSVVRVKILAPFAAHTGWCGCAAQPQLLPWCSDTNTHSHTRMRPENTGTTPARGSGARSAGTGSAGGFSDFNTARAWSLSSHHQKITPEALPAESVSVVLLFSARVPRLRLEWWILRRLRDQPSVASVVLKHPLRRGRTLLKKTCGILGRTTPPPAVACSGSRVSMAYRRPPAASPHEQRIAQIVGHLNYAVRY